MDGLSPACSALMAEEPSGHCSAGQGSSVVVAGCVLGSPALEACPGLHCTAQQSAGKLQGHGGDSMTGQWLVVLPIIAGQPGWFPHCL